MKNIEIRKIDDWGKGVFALKDFKKGDLVYYGVCKWVINKNHSHAS